MFPSKQLRFVFVILFFTSVIRNASVGIAAATDHRSMPIMARKAGGTWKQELTETAAIHKVAAEKDFKNKNSRTKTKRPKCYDDEYYHALGNQCVPKQCPGGNRNRNKDTGECTWDGIVRNNYLSYRRQYV